MMLAQPHEAVGLCCLVLPLILAAVLLFGVGIAMIVSGIRKRRKAMYLGGAAVLVVSLLTALAALLLSREFDLEMALRQLTMLPGTQTGAMRAPSFRGTRIL